MIVRSSARRAVVLALWTILGSSTLGWSVLACGDSAGNAPLSSVADSGDADALHDAGVPEGSSDAPSDGASVDATHPPAIGITVQPSVVSLAFGDTQSFIATVSNAKSASVVWSVVESLGGSIDASGAYSAPNTVGVFHVKATSPEDPSAFGTAEIHVADRTIGLTPLNATVVAGGVLSFGASVSPDGGVTWTSDVGTISNGTYVAPFSLADQDALVTATSVADASKHATATVHVLGGVPHVIGNGGPVLSAPSFTSITFPNDPLVASIDAFIKAIGPSQYWSATTSEYGVSAATANSPVHLTEDAPTTIADSEIQTWLASKLDGTHPEFGPIQPGSVYVIHYPAGTTVTRTTPSPGSSCLELFVYHSYLRLSGGRIVPYVVLPSCATDVDTQTTLLSRALVGVAVDPAWDTGPGFAGTESAHGIWGVATGGEPGDLCALDYPKGTNGADLPSAAQPSWSNVAALAGHDPCVPNHASPYFAAVPILNDDVTIARDAHQTSTKGIHVALNASATFDVLLHSEGSPSTYLVFGDDAIASGARVTFSFGNGGAPTANVTSGSRIAVTVTPLQSANGYNGEPFAIVAVDQATNEAHSFFGYIEN